MNEAIVAKVNVWLEGNFDAAVKEEIKRMQAENPAELADAFYQNLEEPAGSAD